MIPVPGSRGGPERTTTAPPAESGELVEFCGGSENENALASPAVSARKSAESGVPRRKADVFWPSRTWMSVTPS